MQESESKENVEESEVINKDYLFPFLKSGNEDEFRIALKEHFEALKKKYSLGDYHVIILYDESSSISDWHSNRIYDAANNCSDKDILLIVHSSGGKIEPAYLISKTCKSLSDNKFSVAIPRRAKSAATLISIGADEIHMGILSQLGPIDPQVNGLPALGMFNALNTIAKLVCDNPGSTDLFSKVISDKLDLRVLGYLGRISESAVQYAERLLAAKTLPSGRSAQQLADRLVNHYKDHSFVIDAEETKELFGTNILKQDTNEYKFSNDIYSALDFSRFFFDLFHDKSMDFVGLIDSGLFLAEKKAENE